MRIGFIGAGFIAHEHYRALRFLGAQVVGVTSRGRTGPLFSQQYNIPYFSTAEDLVQNTRPDALYLLTHVKAFYVILSPLRKFNIPAFIEKPIPITKEERNTLRTVLP